VSLEVEDFKSWFRDVVYSALQRRAKAIMSVKSWDDFVEEMNRVVEDVESNARSMGVEAQCRAGLVTANIKFKHGTESYGKASLLCIIRRPGRERESMITAYIPMTIDISLSKPSSVAVIGIGEKDDIEVK
jgi:hypothetical protein